MQTVTIKAPARLRSAGDGRLSFTIEIEGNTFHECRRTWRVANLAEGKFEQAGITQIMLPGDVSGELFATIEFSDEWGGRLSGAFRFTIDRQQSSALNVHIGASHSDGMGVNYQPIEVHGAAPKELRVVDGKVLIPITLEKERPKECIPLSDLLEREEVVILPPSPGLPVRVFQIRVGPSLVLGRCYSNQLGGHALDRLREVVEPPDLPRVHWVTNWDDSRVNRISALLRYAGGAKGDRLLITNITDYSRQPSTLVVVGDDSDEQEVEPGARVEWSLTPETDVGVCIGEGSSRRTLARVEFKDGQVGDGLVPVFQTKESSFLFPPSGGDDSSRVRFLGVWLPRTAKHLRDLLQDGDDLHVDFWQDDFRLHFSFDHKAVVVSSNVSLRECIAG